MHEDNTTSNGVTAAPLITLDLDPRQADVVLDLLANDYGGQAEILSHTAHGYRRGEAAEMVEGISIERGRLDDLGALMAQVGAGSLTVSREWARGRLLDRLESDADMVMDACRKRHEREEGSSENLSSWVRDVGALHDLLGQVDAEEAR